MKPRRVPARGVNPRNLSRRRRLCALRKECGHASAIDRAVLVEAPLLRERLLPCSFSHKTLGRGASRPKRKSRTARSIIDQNICISIRDWRLAAYCRPRGYPCYRKRIGCCMIGLETCSVLSPERVSTLSKADLMRMSMEEPGCISASHARYRNWSAESDAPMSRNLREPREYWLRSATSEAGRQREREMFGHL